MYPMGNGSLKPPILVVHIEKYPPSEFFPHRMVKLDMFVERDGCHKFLYRGVANHPRYKVGSYKWQESMGFTGVITPMAGVINLTYNWFLGSPCRNVLFCFYLLSNR